jgi:hypothetical protein
MSENIFGKCDVSLKAGSRLFKTLVCNRVSTYAVGTELLKFMADAGFVCHEILAILAAPRNEIKNIVFLSVLRCQTPTSYITELYQVTTFHKPISESCCIADHIGLKQKKVKGKGKAVPLQA